MGGPQRDLRRLHAFQIKCLTRDIVPCRVTHSIDQIGSNTQRNHSNWDGGAGHADYIACTCIAGGTSCHLVCSSCV